MRSSGPAFLLVSLNKGRSNGTKRGKEATRLLSHSLPPLINSTLLATFQRQEWNRVLQQEKREEWVRSKDVLPASLYLSTLMFKDQNTSWDLRCPVECGFWLDAILPLVLCIRTLLMFLQILILTAHPCTPAPGPLMGHLGSQMSVLSIPGQWSSSPFD